MRILIPFLALATAGLAVAQAPPQYTPDMMAFDGRQTISVPGSEVFAVDGDETIEFWVGPDWTKDPGYDPVVIANIGEKGVSYVIAILRDRDGVGVVSGSTETLAPFDFTDGKLHHVAIIQSDGALHVVVDGAVRGTSSDGLAAHPVKRVWVGSVDGRSAPFVGAVGQLRFWSAALDLETLEAFKLADVLSGDRLDHPYANHLMAMSAFPDPGLLIASAEGESEQ